MDMLSLFYGGTSYLPFNKYVYNRNMFLVCFYLLSVAIRELCNGSNYVLSKRYPVVLIPGEAWGNH